jgi:mRNA-degrading endonuclease RelE of RelBE toxin-antitoxin system
MLLPPSREGFAFGVPERSAIDHRTPMTYTNQVVIVETRAFTTRIIELLSDDEYRELQRDPIERPASGKVIPGTGGLRKLRWASSGRGKRGGARVIYFWHPVSTTLLMLFAYPKNERDDLTPAAKPCGRS